jgi:hypothetical protein
MNEGCLAVVNDLRYNQNGAAGELLLGISLNPALQIALVSGGLAFEPDNSVWNPRFVDRHGAC